MLVRGRDAGGIAASRILKRLELPPARQATFFRRVPSPSLLPGTLFNAPR